LEFKVIDTPFKDSDKNLSVEENRALVKSHLSEITGADVIIADDGSISLGTQNKTDIGWLKSRARVQEIIDSDQVIGITANHLTGAPCFNPKEKSDGPILDEKSKWMDSLGLAAYIGISKKSSLDYKHFTKKGSFLDRIEFYKSTPAADTAHETLGHAFFWATTGETTESDPRNNGLNGENLYRANKGQPSRDDYNSSVIP
jgi:hypothetical protein